MRLVFQARLGLLLCREFAGDATASLQFVLTDTDWLFPRRRFIQQWPETNGRGGGAQAGEGDLGLNIPCSSSTGSFFFFLG